MIPVIQSSGSNSSASAKPKPDGPITFEVPDNLKTLIRMIMKAFYGFELYLCMEMLMYHRCIKEEDLADLLRIDLKLVHQHLVNLKREKFINERSIMETVDGRQSKHSYFYVNYKMMVNVIKYKIDKIRIQIESEEKQCTSRANFKCTNCRKTYSDLDTKDIFLTMTCLYCNAEVEEDVSCLPNRSTVNLQAIFNTQMNVVFQLLSKVENIRLADDILVPQPVDMTHVLEKMNNSSSTSNMSNQNLVNKSNNLAGKSAMNKFDKWSGEKTRNVDLFNQTRISINFDSTDGSSSSLNSRPKKELPAILLSNRTNEDQYDTNSSSRDSELLNSLKIAADATLIHSRTETASTSTNHNNNTNTSNTITTNNNNTNNTNSELSAINNKQSSTLTNLSNTNLESIIWQKLLIHEKKNTEPSTPSTLSNGSFLNGVMNKKRDFETLNKSQPKTGHYLDDKNLLLNKKRKLNNGGLSYKSYSDGSDRELDEQDDESNSYYTDNSNTNLNDNDESSNNNELDYDPYVPVVSVQSKFYRLDKLNTYLINLMNDSEKERYIDICRQLYTEIYEI
jgi:transcription initiation factor IIE alpha subunit